MAMFCSSANYTGWRATDPLDEGIGADPIPRSHGRGRQPDASCRRTGVTRDWCTMSEQKRIAKELDQRVADRTRELAEANEALKHELVVERERTEAARRASDQDSCWFV